MTTHPARPDRTERTESMSEINDAAVEAVRNAIETIHRYTPSPLPLYTADVVSDVERRHCDCGASFLTAQAHREHVYRAALTAALPHLTPEPSATRDEVHTITLTPVDVDLEALTAYFDGTTDEMVLRVRRNHDPKETDRD